MHKSIAMPRTIDIATDSSPLGQAPQDIQHYMRAGTLQLQALPPLALYVHLPWCLKKCPYCDFNSHGLAQGQPLPEQRYIDALMADLEASLGMVWGRPVYSIFIGGGTPSLFSPQAIGQLISGLRARLPLEAGCEITLEANPGTFETERFAAFAQAGVTRLSIGVQSFDDRFLQALGRVHSAAQARAAVAEAAQAFETFNLDVMYALPGQTLADVQRDVQTALSFAPPHLSVYHLSIEPNTYFAKHPPRQLPEDDQAYDMLDAITAATAAHGLQRYEVSAYAQPRHECLHVQPRPVAVGQGERIGPGRSGQQAQREKTTQAAQPEKWGHEGAFHGWQVGTVLPTLCDLRKPGRRAQHGQDGGGDDVCMQPYAKRVRQINLKHVH